MSEKEKKNGNRERRRSALRALLEELSRSDIRNFLDMLREDTDFSETQNEALRDDFAHSQLAILTFEGRKESGLRYQLRWLNRGFERTDTGPAEISGNDLVLHDLPDCFQPMHLISGQGLYEDKVQLKCNAWIDLYGPHKVRRADSYGMKKDEYDFSLRGASDDEVEDNFLELRGASEKKITPRTTATNEIDYLEVTWEQALLSITLETTRRDLVDKQQVFVEWKCGDVFSTQPELRETSNVINPNGTVAAELRFKVDSKRENRNFRVFEVIPEKCIIRPRIEEVINGSGKKLIDTATNEVASSRINVSLSLRTSQDVIKEPSSSMYNGRIYIGPYSDGTVRFRNGRLIPEIDDDGEPVRDLDDLVKRLEEGKHVVRIRIAQDNDQLKEFVSTKIEAFLDNGSIEEINQFVLRCDPPTFKSTDPSSQSLSQGDSEVHTNTIRFFLEDFVLAGICYAARTNGKILDVKNSELNQLISTLLENLRLIANHQDVQQRFEKKSTQEVAAECRAIVDVVRKSPQLIAENLQKGNIGYLFKSVKNYRTAEIQKDSEAPDWYRKQQDLLKRRGEKGKNYIQEQPSYVDSTQPNLERLATALQGKVCSGMDALLEQLKLLPVNRSQSNAVDHLVWYYLPKVVQVSHQLFEQSDKKTFWWADYFHIGVGELLALTNLLHTKAAPRDACWSQFGERLSVSIQKLFEPPASVYSIHGFQSDEGKSDFDMSDEWSQDSGGSSEYLMDHPKKRAAAWDAFVTKVLEVNRFRVEEVYAWARRRDIPAEVAHQLLKEVQSKNVEHHENARNAIVKEIRSKWPESSIQEDNMEETEQQVDRVWLLWQVKERLTHKPPGILLDEESVERLEERILERNKKQVQSNSDRDNPINTIAAILELGYENDINLDEIEFLEAWLLRREDDMNLEGYIDVKGILELEKRRLGGKILGKLLTTTITKSDAPVKNRQKKGDEAEGSRDGDVCIEVLIRGPMSDPQSVDREHQAIVKDLKELKTLVPREVVDYHIARLQGKKPSMTPTNVSLTPSNTP